MSDRENLQKRIDELFVVACELPVEERAAFLAKECRGDPPEVRREVERLLGADATPHVAPPPLPLLPQASVRPLQDSMIGRRVGKFILRRLIGEGGMGSVYLAERTGDFEQKVAIKLIRQDRLSDERVKRFELERQTLADLSHENIAQLLDGGTTEEGWPYFVMEYVDGQLITEYCDKNRMPITDRLKLFQQVCSAVKHAHDFGYLHRDIKPGNILVNIEGMPKLLDFGIAKLVDPRSRGRKDSLTELRMPGTLEYASPEQLRGNRKEISTATDVYSLGVVLYELLTGHSPFQFTNYLEKEMERVVCEEDPQRPSTVVKKPREVMRQGIRESITPGQNSELRQTNPIQLEKTLRGDLETILLQSMHKERSHRYSSPAALSKDIDNYLEGFPIDARRDSTIYRTKKFVKRNKLLVGSTAAIVSTLVVGVISVSAGLIQANKNLERATRAEVASEKAKKEAIKERDNAQQANENTRAQLYFSQMQFAEQQRQLGKFKSARRTLYRTEADLRGWEYDYLLKLLRPRYLPGHSGAVLDIQPLPGSARFLSRDDDGQVYMWSCDQNQPLAKLTGDEEHCTAFSISDKGSIAVLAFEEGKGRLHYLEEPDRPPLSFSGLGRCIRMKGNFYPHFVVQEDVDRIVIRSSRSGEPIHNVQIKSDAAVTAIDLTNTALRLGYENGSIEQLTLPRVPGELSTSTAETIVEENGIPVRGFRWGRFTTYDDKGAYAGERVGVVIHDDQGIHAMSPDGERYEVTPKGAEYFTEKNGQQLLNMTNGALRIDPTIASSVVSDIFSIWWPSITNNPPSPGITVSPSEMVDGHSLSPITAVATVESGFLLGMQDGMILVVTTAMSPEMAYSAGDSFFAERPIVLGEHQYVDWTTREELYTENGKGKNCRGISADTKRMVLLADDSRTVTVIDRLSGNTIASTTLKEDLDHCWIDPACQRIALLGESELSLWQVDSNEVAVLQHFPPTALQRLSPTRSTTTTAMKATFNKSGNRFCSNLDSKRIVCWDSTTGKKLAERFTELTKGLQADTKTDGFTLTQVGRVVVIAPDTLTNVSSFLIVDTSAIASDLDSHHSRLISSSYAIRLNSTYGHELIQLAGGGRVQHNSHIWISPSGNTFYSKSQVSNTVHRWTRPKEELFEVFATKVPGTAEAFLAMSLANKEDSLLLLDRNSEVVYRFQAKSGAFSTELSTRYQGARRRDYIVDWSDRIVCIPGTSSAIAADSAGGLVLWDYETSEQYRLPDTSGVHHLAISSKGNRLLALSSGHTTTFFDVTVSGDQITIHKTHGNIPAETYAVGEAHFCLNNEMVVGSMFSKSDFEIWLWDAATGEPKVKIGSVPSMAPLAVSPDGRYAATGDRNGAVSVWDLARRKTVCKASNHRGKIRDLCFSSDGRHLFSAGEDRVIHVCDSVTGKVNYSLTGHLTSITHLLPSLDGKFLYSCDTRKTLCKWRLPLDNQPNRNGSHPGNLEPASD